MVPFQTSGRAGSGSGQIMMKIPCQILNSLPFCSSSHFAVCFSQNILLIFVAIEHGFVDMAVLLRAW